MNLSGLVKKILRWSSRLYDWRCQWLLGNRFCRLTHVGRKSQREHHTVLEVIGGNTPSGEIIVMSGFGRASDWYQNLHANGVAEIDTGRRHFNARYRDLDAGEAAAVLARYEQQHWIIAPVVRRILSQLSGAHYDGSDAARLKIVSQLPLIAFSPASPA
jgi:deazaflavin-dependent oxidoreductase (nitroreductase family)